MQQIADWLEKFGDLNLHSPDDAVISATLAPIQI